MTTVVACNRETHFLSDTWYELRPYGLTIQNQSVVLLAKAWRRAVSLELWARNNTMNSTSEDCWRIKGGATAALYTADLQ